MEGVIYYKYTTMTEALSALAENGYEIDFNIAGNRRTAGWEKDADAVIHIIYRYEGETDPADETVVYGIETTAGVKGVFVVAYDSHNGAGEIIAGVEMKNEK
ncbi:MAG: hypothetical protein R2794_11410 [Chitinophagales bacterium]